MSALTQTWKDQNRHVQDPTSSRIWKILVYRRRYLQHRTYSRSCASAEKARSPPIIQKFPWAIEFSDGLLVKVAAAAARRASIPISIHVNYAH